MISKSGQSAKLLRSCYDDIDLDQSDRPAFAVRLDFNDYEAEVPQHQHKEGQLILALHGAVTCKTENGIWIVPPDCGVWIPGGVPHSNQVTSNARLSYLFVQPGAATLPHECCTLSVSPMLREMILRLADVPRQFSSGQSCRPYGAGLAGRTRANADTGAGFARLQPSQNRRDHRCPDGGAERSSHPLGLGDTRCHE